MPIWWEAFLRTLLAINTILAISVIFIERKKPTSALAWALALIFLPAAGIIFYITFGIRPRFHRLHRYREKAADDLNFYEEQLKNLSINEGRDVLREDEDALYCQDLIDLNDWGNGSIYTKGNDIEVFTAGKDKFASLINDLRAAKKSIHLVYFIYRDDELGRVILDILTEKARSGVEVRCLLDDIGTYTTPKRRLFKPLVKAGGKVAYFSPARILSLFRVNYRNHRKMAIIDGKVGYLGGMNIGLEYMGIGRKHIDKWRDTHMRITGPSVYMMQIRFLMDWRYASSEPIPSENRLSDMFPPIEHPSKENIGMQIVSSGPDRPEEYIKYGYIKMINNARQEIYLQTPYFVPDDSFAEALRLAALSGVQIYIMLPGQYDKFMVYMATLSFAHDLMSCENIHFYRYNGFLHSKMLVMDGRAVSIGTTNIDIRSFSLHFEVNAFIYNSKFVRKCKDIFYEDLKECTPFGPAEYAARPWYQKFIESIVRLFAPIL